MADVSEDRTVSILRAKPNDMEENEEKEAIKCR
jgi:hypothetical protein